MPIPLKILLVLTIILCIFRPASGSNPGFRSFENVKMDAGANNIYALHQGKDRLIWIGSNQGLYYFDGYRAHRCYAPNNDSNTTIYCIIEDGDNLYLGTDGGILVYDTRRDCYIDNPVKFPHDVRALLLSGNELWIGSLNGLYIYNMTTHEIKSLTEKITHRAVYSLAKTDAGDIFIGTYNGLCCYDCKTRRFSTISITHGNRDKNLFVNALAFDKSRNCIWVGTEGDLFRYNEGGKVDRIDRLSGNSVKSLALDKENTLILGTDNGLYLYSESGLASYRHDSRMAQSLSNNVVWSVIADCDNNIWAGTEYDISVSISNSYFDIIPLSELTGKGEGNRIYNMLRDSKGYLWLGGTNGIIKYDSGKNTEWYMMGSTDHPLPHNRIRDIYEDREGDLWIATDGSINRYDYGNHKFVRYAITDKSGKFNANWAYGIFEDQDSRMWIGSYLGGIHVVDREKLISSNGICIADHAYNTTNGLPNNFINQIVQTKDGEKWVLLYKDGNLVNIDSKNGKIHKIDMLHEVQAYPYYIYADCNSGLWCGFTGGVAKIVPDGTISGISRFGAGENISLFSMEQTGKYLWLSTSKGIWVLDSHSFKMDRMPLPDKNYTGIYYDKASNRILLGGVDEIMAVDPAIATSERPVRKIIITGIYINDTPYHDKKHSIRNLDNLMLNHTQNHVVVEFSDLSYTLNNKESFEYRVTGLSNEWMAMPAGENRISLANIAAGKYDLEIRPLGIAGSTTTLHLEVRPAWYYSTWAIVLYTLFAIGLVVWAINFFRLRIRLKMERIERDKTLEMVNSRMDFLTNISHELKTPLSLIIGPISKLVTDERNAVAKKKLDSILKNAMKLNALIHNALEVDRMNNNPDELLIYSDIEIVGFCKNIFEAYKDTYPNKRFIFNSDIDKQLTEADAVKLESVLNNVVSNACKYSLDDATVAFSVKKVANAIVMTVSDDGVGIPAKELPLIFQRLYQSSATSGSKDGTGIGLYLAKTYIEMHGGSIAVESIENEGSVFTITLPIREVESSVADNNNIDNENKKKILIVDDNTAISDFIRTILCDEYQCLIADSGKAGLAVCGSITPDLMIVDVMMPIMNGLEMCRRIKKNSKLSEIPIILLTAKDDKATEAESIRIGVDTFMPKPFEAPILMARVKQLLKSKEIIRSNVRIEEITSVTEIKAESVEEKQLSEVTKVIEDNIADTELNVGFVCEHTKMTQKQLYRLIKKYIGISPIDYIRQIRMKKAAMLLQQNKFTVSEVMYMVGFSSSSYFSKCFNAQFGCTPKQYSEMER